MERFWSLQVVYFVLSSHVCKGPSCSLFRKKYASEAVLLLFCRKKKFFPDFTACLLYGLCVCMVAEKRRGRPSQGKKICQSCDLLCCKYLRAINKDKKTGRRAASEYFRIFCFWQKYCFFFRHLPWIFFPWMSHHRARDTISRKTLR